MAKAPSESRIPTFGSRIPVSGSCRFLPTLRISKPVFQAQKSAEKNCAITLDTTNTVSKNRTITLDTNTLDKNRTFTLDTNTVDKNCTITLDTNTVDKNCTITLDTTTVDNNCTITLDTSTGDNNCTITLDTDAAEVTYNIQNTSVDNDDTLDLENHHVCVDDIGQRVCVADSEPGTLKYLGEVQFSNGLWCGIELDKPVGKHDGCVTGVRYFLCRPNCGIMAPISKVTLFSDNNIKQVCDSTLNMISADDQSDISGPYSILEPQPVEADSRTEDLTENNDSAVILKNKQVARLKSECCISSKTAAEGKVCASSPIFQFGQTSEKGCLPKFSISPITTTTPDYQSSTKQTLGASTAYRSTPVQTPSLPKQNSFELDESLGILTPDQMLEFSALVESSKTPSSEDLKSLLSKRSDKTISNSRTPSAENLGSLPYDGSSNPPEEMEPPLSAEHFKPLTRPDSIDLKHTVDLVSKFSKFSTTEMSSPSGVENSMLEFSLGLIDEDMLASANQFSSNLDTTTNLDLPLDSVGGSDKIEKFKSLSRSEQTPSPEDLPLDPIDSIKPIEIDILEPILIPSSTESDLKNDVSKSTTSTAKTSSFITSVTSITSLDTGYQGDGEMSRPASRGADNSPVAHKPNNPALANLHWQRSRRPDPMTDSDFFTESDMDGHEENVPRGDRHAQVIDGTLYGVNAQPAVAPQDIFLGNQEEMDSSGVFTDLDMNTRIDDFSDNERHKMQVITPNEDKSPTDTSTNTISDNSQEIKDKDLNSTVLVVVNNNDTIIHHVSTEILDSSGDKITSPTQSIVSTPGSRKNQRVRTPLSNAKDENPAKKFKMPNRNVTSKVKQMMETSKSIDSDKQDSSTKNVRKLPNRWDAVMNKISKGEENKAKSRLKEVKSKVSTGITGALPSNKRGETRKFVQDETTAKSRIRRLRTRADPSAGNKLNNRINSSVHSSLSDLSVSVSRPKPTSAHSAINRVNKKREAGVGRCSTPVTEVLTPGGHKPTPVTLFKVPTNQQRNARNVNKNPVLPASSVPEGAKENLGRRPPLRRIVNTTPNKLSGAKDQSRITGASSHKGDSPIRSQILQETKQPPNLLPHVKHSAKGVEALGVLVQYLVFNLDAFCTPSLKRELETIKSKWMKDKLELEETRMSLEEEQVKYNAEITELIEKHRRYVTQIKEQNAHEIYNLETKYQDETQRLKSQLDAEISNRENEIAARIDLYANEQNYKLQEVAQENERLRLEHQTTIEILQEENHSLQEQLEDKDSFIKDLQELRYRNEKLKNEFLEKERLADDKLMNAHEQIAMLKEENKKILETFKSDTKDNKLQVALARATQLRDEVASLQAVLQLKLAEISELRRSHGELVQATEDLGQAILRAQTLQARVEDLEMQIARKTESEMAMSQENKKLLDICSQEQKQKNRLLLYNEELQWKLKQNSEVLNTVFKSSTPNRKSLHGSNQSLCEDLSSSSSYKTPSGGYLSRSFHTSSFNEKHTGTSSQHMLDRTLSFREKSSRFIKDPQTSRISDFDNDTFSSKSDYLEPDDSPPSSPKVKGVVEKSDSVSWVLDMDESPEILASRMVRRTGSFRNITPPKCSQKSPATKRPRTKSNNLSLSASAGAIVSPGSKNDNRYRSKSVSLRNSQSPENCHSDEYLSKSWHYSLRTSTAKSGLEPIRSGTKLENNPDLEHDSDAAISLPALPSEIKKPDMPSNNLPDSLPSLPSGDLLLLQSAFPKNSAGEAMISESNSEDECSSSTSERSPSVSDTETSEEPTGSASVDKCLEKNSKLQYDLYLMTESTTTTNSEAMDCSWSEELDV